MPIPDFSRGKKTGLFGPQAFQPRARPRIGGPADEAGFKIAFGSYEIYA